MSFIIQAIIDYQTCSACASKHGLVVDEHRRDDTLREIARTCLHVKFKDDFGICRCVVVSNLKGGVMSLFACSKCEVVENTATSRYHVAFVEGQELLCSECDPEIAKWHGRFPRTTMDVANYQFCSDYEQRSRILCPKPNGWDYCKHREEKERKQREAQAHSEKKN